MKRIFYIQVPLPCKIVLVDTIDLVVICCKYYIKQEASLFIMSSRSPLFVYALDIDGDLYHYRNFHWIENSASLNTNRLLMTTVNVGYFL